MRLSIQFAQFLDRYTLILYRSQRLTSLVLFGPAQSSYFGAILNRLYPAFETSDDYVAIAALVSWVHTLSNRVPALFTSNSPLPLLPFLQLASRVLIGAGLVHFSM